MLNLLDSYGTARQDGPGIQGTCNSPVRRFLKETDGAGMAASRLGMSVATFYRRCNENKGKKKEEPFV
jgi:peptide deformylase